MKPSAAEFWSFSLDVYKAPGVKDMCLTVQDQYGADVNLLLLCAWFDHEALILPADSFASLLARSGEWQGEILAPHRTRRRAAKGTSDYETLLQEELRLEKAAQAALLVAADGATRATQPNNCARYMAHLEAPESLLTPLLDAIRRS